MSDEPTHWFPVKRYGWGWGLPVRWQGWAVFGMYAALLYAGIYDLITPRNAIALALYILLLTGALIAVVAVKGERPLRWRWGKE
jgi:hypothetical protein